MSYTTTITDVKLPTEPINALLDLAGITVDKIEHVKQREVAWQHIMKLVHMSVNLICVHVKKDGSQVQMCGVYSHPFWEYDANGKMVQTKGSCRMYGERYGIGMGGVLLDRSELKSVKDDGWYCGSYVLQKSYAFSPTDEMPKVLDGDLYNQL